MNERRISVRVLAAMAGLAAALTYCRQPVDEEFADDAWYEEVDGTTSGLLKGQTGATNGDYNYCDGRLLCINGEGDCDADSECTAGAVCGKDNGAAFGMPKSWDVCVAPHCTNRTQDVDETGPDCGGADCGACGGLSCAGTNGDADFCVTGCACSQGQGDCDYDSDCSSGLFCKRKVGASFGLSPTVDVCIPNHCKNNVQDADEVRVDCGGSCQACAYALSVLNDRPVAYWRLGEASGTSARDESGNGNHGTYSNASLGVAGALTTDPNTAAGWNGTNGFMSANIVMPLNVTVEVWGRSATPNWNVYGWLFSGRGQNGVLVHPSVGTKSWNGYVLNGSATHTLIGTHTPADITGWHHYAVSYDNGTGVAKMYFDGALVVTANLAAGLRSGSPSSTVMTGRDNCCGARYGNGATDELAIYPSVLPDARIAAHYLAGKPN